MPSPVNIGRTNTARMRAVALRCSPALQAAVPTISDSHAGRDGVIAEQQIGVARAADEGGERLDIARRIVRRAPRREGGCVDVAGRREVIDGQGSQRHHLRKVCRAWSAAYIADLPGWSYSSSHASAVERRRVLWSAWRLLAASAGCGSGFRCVFPAWRRRRGALGALAARRRALGTYSAVLHEQPLHVLLAVAERGLELV